MLAFAMKWKMAIDKSHWDILVFKDQWNIMSDFNMSHGKNIWFCFISIAWVHFSLQTEKFPFESHWNTLIFYDKKDRLPDLNMSHGKIISFRLIWFKLVIKLRNFDFEGDLNTVMFFDYKMILKWYWKLILKNKMIIKVIFDYVLWNSIWFGLSFVVWVKLWK